MSREALIQAVGEWLIDQALAEPEIVSLFDQTCNRLRAVGVPIDRARLTWPTLHPLFQAETVLWKRGEETELEQFRHQDEASEQWKASPMAFMFEHNTEEFRRNLDGDNKLIDFPILHDLVEEGMTDYLIIATSFEGDHLRHVGQGTGIFVSWASDRAGGFSDDDLSTLKRIQRRFATAVKAAVQRRIAKNVTETYLGRHAGDQVLNGAIKLGDGRETQAVVWYADMRDSTQLAEEMEPSDFLELLNDYFECTAAPAIEHGGEVLDFIGDAVLAIFPYEDDAGRSHAIQCATRALEQTLSEGERINAERKAAGKPGFRYGVGINSGKLMFGNIGVPSRLSFSVIGATINEVERIEELTKTLNVRVLATEAVATCGGERWVSLGYHNLKGVNRPHEVFGLRVEAAQDNVVAITSA